MPRRASNCPILLVISAVLSAILAVLSALASNRAAILCLFMHCLNPTDALRLPPNHVAAAGHMNALQAGFNQMPVARSPFTIHSAYAASAIAPLLLIAANVFRTPANAPIVETALTGHDFWTAAHQRKHGHSTRVQPCPAHAAPSRPRSPHIYKLVV